MTQSESTYSLLALCARAQGHPIQYEQLKQQAPALTDSEWAALPAQAESHGLAPLFYAHLPAAGVPMPAAARQQLQGRAMQHSHANRVRAKALAEVLAAFQAAGIDALVLKGMALAHLVYPEPGLRVMRDVDVLVSRSQARQAQALLAEMGFNAPPPGHNLPAKHLAVAQRQVEGLLVSLELHHNLYTEGTSTTELEALRPAAIPFTLENVTAYTLGHEEMLAHLYRHLRVSMHILPGLDVLRLIWIADLVSLAEGCAKQIDWERVAPQTRYALAACHWLTPLSGELLQTASLNPGRPPQGAGQQFQGWPRHTLAEQRHKSYGGIVRDSFFPPEWWLRFYYGLPPGPACWWGRWARHPLHILGWVGRYCRRRVKH
ncbi:MAG: nucleotidyltransferase family protein [Anaerolineae bacterium]|nr:nucleotidyltransferase family protein [Anaerolineae bacterium]